MCVLQADVCFIDRLTIGFPRPMVINFCMFSDSSEKLKEAMGPFLRKLHLHIYAQNFTYSVAGFTELLNGLEIECEMLGLV